MLDPKIWKRIDNLSTGYLGKKRNAEWARRDEMYGAGNWRMSWYIEGKLLEYADVCQIYGQAYYDYFRMRPELLDYLVKIARDVFDDDPANVEAGTDYSVRGSTKTHIHDTAIRQAMKRLGKTFQGEELFQISNFNNNHPLAIALSPGQVRFHKPEWLSNPDNLDYVQKDAWWVPGSVEDFYQRAKRLCVRVNPIKDSLEYNIQEGA